MIEKLAKITSSGLVFVFILFMCFWVALGQASHDVLAASLPQSEQQALKEWTNWVASSCSNSGAATSNVLTDFNAQAAQQAAQQASSGSTKVGYALYDSTGKLLANFNDTFENYGASITKSMLLVAYLKQIGSGSISSSAQSQLTNMIENSDNSAADWVYTNLSNGAAAVNQVASDAGMSGFKLDISDPTYLLGQSKITADDFAKFFAKIDQMMPSSQQSFGLNLLSHLSSADQTGLLQAGLPGTVYSKEGWKPESSGLEGAPYIVNQAAQFSSGGTTYGVAVTVGGTSDQSSGETIVKNVVSALVTSVGQSTQSQVSSCCSDGSSSSPTSSSGSTGSSSTSSGSFTIDQVKTFASEPITSTWNISNSTVEQWFLKTNTYAISKYGLSSSNIGQITAAVQAAGVSPVFFYLDTVNEGGGAGGFINHYQSDAAGGGPGNAKTDSQYIVSESHTTADGPANGGGDIIPSTAEAKSILDSLPKGSLGVYYIQATTAVTGELEDLSGKNGGDIAKYGHPMSQMMQNIKTMGGDPLQGGSSISSGSGCCAGGTAASGPSTPTVMYDTLNPAVVPPGAQVIASYVGGGRHGFSQINSGVDAVSINETPGDNTSADIWADEEDVNVTSATGAAQPGFHSNNSHSAAEVAAAIANWVHHGSPAQLSPTGEAKGAYGTPGSGFQLQQIEKLLSNQYHVSRNKYVVWSDGLYPNGQPRSQSLPPGTDANQNAINLGGGYDTDQITPAFLARLGFSNGGAGASASTSSGGCTASGVAGQGIAKAVSWAVMIANNNGYGYDEPTRTSGWVKWQSDPSCTNQCGSFDCSSLIAAALTEAGYFKTNPNFATGTEATALTGVGFKKIADSATTSAGLQPGDILLWAGHTEMYIGNDQAVAAHINENGGASGGQVGDQTGHEISVESFGSSLSSYPWIGVYRAP